MHVFELARRLIEIESITENEKRVAFFLKECLSGLKYDVSLQEAAPGRFNVMAFAGKPDLVFTSHIDTVPPYIPFREDEEYIYGRGACDAKGIVAAQIEAVAGDIEIHATKTGMLGTAAIVEVVAASVKELDLPLLVVDPVMLAKSRDARPPNGGAIAALIRSLGEVRGGRAPHDFPSLPALTASERRLMCVLLARLPTIRSGEAAPPPVSARIGDRGKLLRSAVEQHGGRLDFLADGRHFLYASLPGRGRLYPISVGRIDDPKWRERLMTAEGVPVYVRPGWLLYSRNDRIVAHRFDAGRRRLIDEPVAKSKWNETVMARAQELAARSDRPRNAKGIVLTPLDRQLADGAIEPCGHASDERAIEVCHKALVRCVPARALDRVRHGACGREHVVGLEPWIEMRSFAIAKQARLGIRNVEFVDGVAEDLSRFGDGSFDRVISVHGAPFPWDDEAFVRGCLRVVRAGGIVLFGGTTGVTESITLPEVNNVDRREMLNWERELIGLYISDHPLTEYQQTLAQLVSYFSGQLAEANHEEKVRVAGLITAVRPYTTKQGKPMGFVTLEDIQGNIELVLFPRTWAS